MALWSGCCEVAAHSASFPKGMKKPNKTGHEQVHAREISELHRGACQSGLRCKNWERTENFVRSRIWLAIGKRFMVTNQAHHRCVKILSIIHFHALPTSLYY